MSEQQKKTDSQQNKESSKNEIKVQNSVLDSDDENEEILNNLNNDSITSNPLPENNIKPKKNGQEQKKQVEVNNNTSNIQILAEKDDDEEENENASAKIDEDEQEEQIEITDISKIDNQNLEDEIQITKDVETINSNIQENGQSNAQTKFCKTCKKVFDGTCEEHADSLIPYNQLTQDFKKYKLYCEQYDPLYNIQKGLNKIKEALSHINIPALQEDYVLKKKIFKENSKLEDYLDKIIYRNDKLLIDDLHLLPNLDELKRESYLIDMIHSNYNFVKQFLLKAQDYRYENQILKNINPKNKKRSLEILGNMGALNIKRNQSFLTQNGQDDLESSSQKRLKQEDEEGYYNNRSNLISNNSYEENTTQQQQWKNPSYEVGLENMNPKEQEVLKIMYNTNYEKHHHFREIEKKIFAKFALLRKIKNGITVSVTTDQWRLNRITVQIWLDKYKKQFSSKPE
ncbi:hypothetical protein PPERSA_07110 [Pseudocohnilembus persalinus]|uniref:Uncharacterized protein n=1 Tax=Pseudocohnilembus persalinus TaxID=266149 RepID=A0A0V0QX31_PSEPJ|nr:hypothetical protein PPERSA_07110 [Pseudocohnilembus persalinus]|eukprot:KRX06947.1 hypothetical protein PPERSA_07110 [Pseudocohnilembus persalinus]